MLDNELTVSPDLAWTGEETIFAAGFQALSLAHVTVSFVAPSGAVTALVDGVHLTLSRDAGGFVSAVPLALPAAPGILRFRRVTPALQDVDFINLGGYSPEVHERLADAAAMRAAETTRDIAEALAEGGSPDADDVTFADPRFDAPNAGDALRELKTEADQPLDGAAIVAAIDAALGSGQWQVPGSGIGEANVGANLGSAENAIGVYEDKSGLTLRFRGILGMDGVASLYDPGTKTIFLSADLPYLSTIYVEPADLGALALLATVGPAEIAAEAVTFSKVAPAALATLAEAQAGVVANKLMTPERTKDAIVAIAATAGRFIGEVIETSSQVLSPGCVWANGQALSRTTYADLFAATVATGSGITFDPATDRVTWNGHGRSEGDVVQFFTTGNMPGGLVEAAKYYVVNPGANTFWISPTPGGAVADITSTGSGTHSVQHGPYGLGNATTTFNVVNRMERAGIGRAGMGGLAGPGVVSGAGTGNPGMYPQSLGYVAGADRHQLTVGQTAAHAHGNIRKYSQLGTVEDGAGATQIWKLTEVVTTAVAGGDQAHPQLPPEIVMNYMVFTGVV